MTRRASALTNLDEIYQLIRECQSTLEQTPGCLHTRAIRAHAFMKAKLWEHAIQDFTIILQARPDDVHGRFSRGMAYFKCGKVEEAHTDFSKVLELNPHHVMARYARAGCYNTEGSFHHAIEDYTIALQHDESEAEVLGLRGEKLPRGWHEDAEKLIHEKLSGKDALFVRTRRNSRTNDDRDAADPHISPRSSPRQASPRVRSPRGDKQRESCVRRDSGTSPRAGAARRRSSGGMSPARASTATMTPMNVNTATPATTTRNTREHEHKRTEHASTTALLLSRQSPLRRASQRCNQQQVCQPHPSPHSCSSMRDSMKQHVVEQAIPTITKIGSIEPEVVPPAPHNMPKTTVSAPAPVAAPAPVPVSVPVPTPTPAATAKAVMPRKTPRVVRVCVQLAECAIAPPVPTSVDAAVPEPAHCPTVEHKIPLPPSDTRLPTETSKRRCPAIQPAAAIPLVPPNPASTTTPTPTPTPALAPTLALAPPIPTASTIAARAVRKVKVAL